MVTLQDIGFQEGKLLVKTLCEQDELEEAYRLRHRVFPQNLKWYQGSCNFDPPWSFKLTHPLLG